MTKTPQHNVPELRFPEFEGEWNILKLNEVLLDKTEGIKRGPFGGALKKEIFVNEGYAIYEQRNAIYDNQEFRYYINKDKYEEMKSFEVQPGDLIMSCSGTIGKLSKIPKDYKKGIINQALIRFRTKSNILSQYFLFYMRSNIMQRKILEVNPGSAITNLIPVKELKNLCFPLPNLNEQEKIGTFFSKLDRQIELEEKKLELLEQQKKGYMQKIFSQELRFKDENGNEYPKWEETTIEKTTKYSSSKKSSNQYTESNDSEGYPVYDAIQEIGKDLQYDMKEPYISILKDGAGVGRLNLRAGQSSVIGTMGYLQPNNVDLQFLYYKMNMLNFKKYVIGSTIPHLYYKDYSKEKIQIPSSFEEQKKIGHFILNIDKMIEIKTFKIDYLKQRKQGLLQKMFI
ncbi:restriction endonuclease subunit S [Staphylococcus chromogenes]|uniref:restriction endonuclease subunit S n=1 Tax=Staphylococcus chromogenes TaxID=46126 RepID=UPI000CD26AA9|nr:restriction endonuclease subunit S [Staphylococcus chromogenes]MBP0046471.1 restriction endonuclease subunit S [Staphylococcus chromogenes]PNY96338.1 restriction endonuclease subunit S [Staphylococcus chromogenes]GGI32784.1 restriction endonuclease [Staphylococcus chromogenes]SUM11355.1 putative restriction and modification system specificity protein [Staphylococcus chromogenes]